MELEKFGCVAMDTAEMTEVDGGYVLAAVLLIWILTHPSSLH